MWIICLSLCPDLEFGAQGTVQGGRFWGDISLLYELRILLEGVLPQSQTEISGRLLLVQPLKGFGEGILVELEPELQIDTLG